MEKEKNSFFKTLYCAFLINLILVVFISKDYIKYIEYYEDFLSKIYFITTIYSHFYLLLLPSLIIPSLLYWAIKKRTLSVVLYVILSFSTFALLKIDSSIFSQFRYHISPLVFNLVFGKRASDIFQFSTENIIFASLLFIVLLILPLVSLYFGKKIKISNTFKYTFYTFLLTFFTSNAIFAWSDVNFYRPVTQYKNILPVFYPLTADKLLTKLGLTNHELIERNRSLVNKNDLNTLKYPLNNITSSPKENKKNILFIVVDSWRYDYLTEDICPNLYELSKESQVFTNHSSGSNMTTGGIFSLFYGIPATYYNNFTGLEKQPVLFSELQKQNYNIEILSSSTLENPPFNRNVFSKIPNLRLNSISEKPSDRDIEINNEWLNKLNNNKLKQPFFGLLFYDSAHGFDCPDNFNKKFVPSLESVDYLGLNDDYDPTKLINRYKNSLYFIDSLIGKVIKQLEEKNLLESTLIVVTGDHGQEFNDNKKGYWQHGGNFSKYQIRTPLMIFDFDKKPKVYEHNTVHYDIVPTIMKNNLNVKNPYNDYSVGKSLYDSTIERNWFICGYNEKYSVIEKNRITNIFKSGSFEVLDSNLNYLNEDINFEVISEALKQTSTFYQIK